MRSNLLRLLFPVVAAAAVFAPGGSSADEPLVFISSFAAGKDGGIEAFRLDPKTGRLTRLERAAGVENTYFMAVSPDSPSCIRVIF